MYRRFTYETVSVPPDMSRMYSGRGSRKVRVSGQARDEGRHDLSGLNFDVNEHDVQTVYITLIDVKI